MDFTIPVEVRTKDKPATSFIYQFFVLYHTKQKVISEATVISAQVVALHSSCPASHGYSSIGGKKAT